MTTLEISPRPTMLRLKHIKERRPNVVIILPAEGTSQSWISDLRAENPDVEVHYFPTYESRLVHEVDRVHARLAVKTAIEALEAGKHVVVSCIQSMNRSPSLAAVVWAYRRKIPLPDAVKAVRAARPAAVDMRDYTLRMYVDAVRDVYGYEIPGAPPANVLEYASKKV